MGGTIALVEDGDEIEIDIPARVLKVNVSDEVLAKERLSGNHLFKILQDILSAMLSM